ncbi:protein of unknown function (plasmid) [Caballeronia sp. S22]
MACPARLVSLDVGGVYSAAISSARLNCLSCRDRLTAPICKNLRAMVTWDPSWRRTTGFFRARKLLRSDERIVRTLRFAPPSLSIGGR